ncbi:hypothetical protein Bca52824_023740 [Brassica carinata]|uniref:Uncharacterized protein n=1 Tax=Brassica carinata TaxID=52824 RepID=A0A8X7VIC7_BRACI|nr:hypothetical protein Bca52824_023740 [Brassica carinata]
MTVLISPDAHFDYFHDKVNIAHGGQRIATVLMYLSNVTKGGETVFPDAVVRIFRLKLSVNKVDLSDCAKKGIAVKPKKGSCERWAALGECAKNPEYMVGTPELPVTDVLVTTTTTTEALITTTTPFGNKERPWNRRERRKGRRFEIWNPSMNLSRASSSPPQGQPVAMAKYVLIPGHAKEMDVKCQVPFRSILNDPDEEWAFGKDFAWDDETYDEAVDTLVRLIEEFFVFRMGMFKGGLRTADISHMRGEKLKEKEGKEHQEKEKEDRENASEPKDADVSARRSRGPSGVNIREELMAMEGRVLAAFDAHNESISGRFGFEKKIAELQKVVSVLNDIEGRVKSNISDAVEVMQESVTQSILDFLRNPIFSAPPGRSSPVDKETDEAETGKGNEPADVAFDAQADLSGGQNSVGTHPINVPVCPNAAVRKVFDDLNSAGDTVAEGRKVSDHDEPVLIPDQDVFDEVEDPTFLLGVTQEDSRETAVIAKPVGYVIPRDNDQADNKEGRKKTLFIGLAEELNPIEHIDLGGRYTVSTMEFLDIAHRKQQMSTKFRGYELKPAT